MKSKKYFDSSSDLIILIITAIVIIFIWPWLSFWVAYFLGWITKITIGKYIVEGFALLNIDLPLNKIPLLAGVLGWIGGFFIGTKGNRKKES